MNKKVKIIYDPSTLDGKIAIRRAGPWDDEVSEDELKTMSYGVVLGRRGSTSTSFCRYRIYSSDGSFFDLWEDDIQEVAGSFVYWVWERTHPLSSKQPP